MTPSVRKAVALERLFAHLLGGLLVLALLLVVGILGGMAAYVNWPDWIRWTFSTPAGSRFLGQIGRSIALSILTSGATTGIALAFGVPIAYALSRFNIPVPILVDTILDLPIVLPPLVAGVALLTVFRYWLGPFFDAMGVQIHYTSRGIVIAQLFIAGPFAIRAVKSAFDDVSPRYEAVARTLGCTRFEAFMKVGLPLARNGIIAGAVMTWARAVSEFGPILIFCSASEKTAVLPIRVFLYNSAGNIAAGVVTSVVLIFMAAGALICFKLLGGRRLSL